MIYLYLKKRLSPPLALSVAAGIYLLLLLAVFMCLNAPEARFLYGRL